MMRGLILTLVVLGAAFGVNAAPTTELLSLAGEPGTLAPAAAVALCGLGGVALLARKPG